MSHEDDEEEVSVAAKIAVHMPEISPALKHLCRTVEDIINGLEDHEALLPALAKWQEVRQMVNNSENAGVAIAMNGFKIAGFNLTGDLTRDIGQVNRSKS